MDAAVADDDHRRHYNFLLGVPFPRSQVLHKLLKIRIIRLKFQCLLCGVERFGKSLRVILFPSENPGELRMSVSIGGRELRRSAQCVLRAIEVTDLPKQITQMSTVMRV